MQRLFQSLSVPSLEEIARWLNVGGTPATLFSVRYSTSHRSVERLAEKVAGGFSYRIYRTCSCWFHGVRLSLTSALISLVIVERASMRAPTTPRNFVLVILRLSPTINALLSRRRWNAGYRFPVSWPLTRSPFLFAFHLRFLLHRSSNFSAFIIRQFVCIVAAFLFEFSPLIVRHEAFERFPRKELLRQLTSTISDPTSTTKV